MRESEAYSFGQGDIVFLVGEEMSKAGVEGLPRNYALFYRAHIEADESLRSQLQQLGHKPLQEELDKLFDNADIDAAHFAMIDGAHGRVTKLAGEIMDLLAQERSSLEKYVDLLDCTTSGISDKQVEQEILRKIAGILSSATNSALRQSQESADHMSKRSAELQKIRKELESYKNLADTDELTGLGNRRAFNRSIARIYQDKRRLIVSSLVLLDIDRFKNLNDQHGHLVGDRVLKQVAQLIRSKCGSHISVFRVGGEEFALIVEGLGDTSTEALVNRIRQVIENHEFGEAGNSLAVTISGGICKAADGSNSDDLFAKTDSALYVSKASGRNRITSFPFPEKATAERKNWMLYQNE